MCWVTPVQMWASVAILRFSFVLQKNSSTRFLHFIYCIQAPKIAQIVYYWSAKAGHEVIQFVQCTHLNNRIPLTKGVYFKKQLFFFHMHTHCIYMQVESYIYILILFKEIWRSRKIKYDCRNSG